MRKSSRKRVLCSARCGHHPEKGCSRFGARVVWCGFHLRRRAGSGLRRWGFPANMIERQISRNGRISRGESTVPTCRHAGKPRDPAPTYPQAVLRTSRQLIMPDRANAVAGSAKSRVSRALQEPSRQGSSRQELPMRPPGPAPPAASRLIACKQMNESCSDHGCRAGRKEAVSDVPLGQVRPRLD